MTDQLCTWVSCTNPKAREVTLAQPYQQLQPTLRDVQHQNIYRLLGALPQLFLVLLVAQWS